MQAKKLLMMLVVLIPAIGIVGALPTTEPNMTYASNAISIKVYAFFPAKLALTSTVDTLNMTDASNYKGNTTLKIKKSGSKDVFLIITSNNSTNNSFNMVSHGNQTNPIPYNVKVAVGGSDSVVVEQGGNTGPFKNSSSGKEFEIALELSIDNNIATNADTWGEYEDTLTIQVAPAE
jgi:hypothetical protein